MVFEVAADAVGVGLPVEVLDRPGELVVVLEPVTLRVELGLPVVVELALVELDIMGLELDVFELPTERVPVFVEVVVLLSIAVTVA